MSSKESNFAMAKTILTTLGTIAATAMVFRTIAHDYVPQELQDYLFLGLRKFFSKFSTQLTVVIQEFDGLVNNEIYEAAEAYLSPKITLNTRLLKIKKTEKEKNMDITMASNEEVTDVYQGAKFTWVWVCRQVESKNSPEYEVKSFELTFHNKHKDFVINSYLPYVMKEAKFKKQVNKTLKIFTADYENLYDWFSNKWTSVSLDHPATFETLAMDPNLKEMVLNDLQRFVNRKEYFRKVGKAWKRGYLLYGPPGTGKSSLIAAMANYLNFDIYDLELTELKRNSDLRKLLLATSNRSILVVEDIDCTIDLQDRLAKKKKPDLYHEEDSKVTMSGFLNFIDGLWSSCGDERIIIFTTNHKDKLDPALLRPGRMDVHIHMSYCTPCGFKLLAANYLGIKDHVLFGKIEKLIQTTEVTPAEVAEQLLKDGDEPDSTLSVLFDFLCVRKKENEEAKVKKEEQESIEQEDQSEKEDKEDQNLEN